MMEINEHDLWAGHPTSYFTYIGASKITSVKFTKPVALRDALANARNVAKGLEDRLENRGLHVEPMTLMDYVPLMRDAKQLLESNPTVDSLPARFHALQESMPVLLDTSFLNKDEDGEVKRRGDRIVVDIYVHGKPTYLDIAILGTDGFVSKFYPAIFAPFEVGDGDICFLIGCLSNLYKNQSRALLGRRHRDAHSDIIVLDARNTLDSISSGFVVPLILYHNPTTKAKIEIERAKYIKQLPKV